MSRRTIVVIDDFYRDPDAVRRYALEQDYYTPYEDTADVLSGKVRPSWWATKFRPASECPFKSSGRLLAALEAAVGETIRRVHWRATFPVDAESKPIKDADRTQACLWNCCFHVKPDNGQQVGEGVHNHVTDRWNAVGVRGWAGIIYLNPDAPSEGGLHLWQNVDPQHKFQWMTSPPEWRLMDSFANQYNRLTLVRGDLPHSGAGGWGDSLESGRLYQTFFFRTRSPEGPWPDASVAGVDR
jgi:hypothetical protein